MDGHPLSSGLTSPVSATSPSDVMYMETELKKKPDDMMHSVLLDISNERREAHENLKKLVKGLNDQIADITVRDAALVEEFGNAKADLKAVERYLPHLSKQEYDAKYREVQARHDEVQARHRAACKRAEEEVVPTQERLKAAQLKVQELASEWRSHLRMAKASGLDTTKYWTPENPVE
jgi:paraquat-inducible protein B